VSRARRTAETLLRRSRFSPPVPVDRLARQYAELEDALIPGACDGLIIGLDPSAQRQPTIVVARGSPARRRRLTIAHELGHLMLPWHAGQALACDTPTAWYEAGSTESEANEFAAELLMPSAWIRDNVERAQSISELLALTEVANTSAQSLCIAVARVLPPGHIWAIFDLGTVAASGRSADSSVLPPKVGSTPDFDQLKRFASDFLIDVVAGRTVAWWNIEATQVPPHGSVDTKALIREILSDYIPEPNAKRRGLQAIAGIGGAAKSMAADSSDPTLIHGRLRLAFTRRDDFPAAMLDDPRFRTWLAARANELAG
jgi:hypothetical protein